MILISDSCSNEINHKGTLVFQVKDKGYEIGLCQFSGGAFVRFILEYDNSAQDTDADMFRLYKCHAMSAADVAELVLDMIGQGAVKNITTLSDDELTRKFHLILRDYLINQVDLELGV